MLCRIECLAFQVPLNDRSSYPLRNVSRSPIPLPFCKGKKRNEPGDHFFLSRNVVCPAAYGSEDKHDRAEHECGPCEILQEKTYSLSCEAKSPEPVEANRQANPKSYPVKTRYTDYVDRRKHSYDCWLFGFCLFPDKRLSNRTVFFLSPLDGLKVILVAFTGVFTEKSSHDDWDDRNWHVWILWQTLNGSKVLFGFLALVSDWPRCDAFHTGADLGRC